MEKIIKILPEFGDAYKVILFIPNDEDEDEFVDVWLDDHTINVQNWEWA